MLTKYSMDQIIQNKYQIYSWSSAITMKMAKLETFSSNSRFDMPSPKYLCARLLRLQVWIDVSLFPRRTNDDCFLVGKSIHKSFLRSLR